MDCSHPGSDELYGLGIRLGLYLTWVTCQLLHHFGGSWATLNRTRTAGNTISAAVILLLTINITGGDGLEIDYLIVYHLTTTLFLTESYNTLTQRPGSPGCTFDLRPDFAVVWQNIQSLYMSLFGAWVWIRGPGSIPHQSSPCGLGRGALYGIFSIDNGSWRRFAATFAILTAVAFLFLLLLHASSIPKTIIRGPVAREMMGRKRRVKAQPGFRIRRQDWACVLRPWMDIWQAGFSGRKCRIFLWIMWSLTTWVAPSAAIVSVERMIHTNNLTLRSVTKSSGQTIALLLGVVNLSCAVVDISVGYYRTKKRSTKDPLVSHAYLQPRDIVTYEDLKETLRVTLQAMKDSGSVGHEYMSEMQIYSRNHHDLELSNLLRQTRRQLETAHLFRAAETGDVEAIRLAVEDENFILDGAKSDLTHTTPLIEAAKRGHTDIVQLLATDRRVDVNHQDDVNGTALVCAAAKGHQNVVQTLLAVDGVDPNGREACSQFTALAEAAANGHVSIVKMLLEYQTVDANAKSNTGATPIFLAAQHGHLKVIEILVESDRCIIDSRNDDGRSPVDVAQMNGHEKIAQFLVSAQSRSSEMSLGSSISLDENKALE